MPARPVSLIVRLFKDQPRRDRPPSWRAEVGIGRHRYLATSTTAPVHALASRLALAGIPDRELLVLEGLSSVEVSRHASFHQLANIAAGAGSRRTQ